MTCLLFCSFYRLERFNPCFGGSYIVTKTRFRVVLAYLCFNPCFGGSYIVTALIGLCIAISQF